MLVVYTPSHLCRSVAGCFSYTVETRYKQSATSNRVEPVQACVFLFSLQPPQHTTTTLHYTLFSSRLLSSTGVVPPFVPGAGVFWRGVRSPVVVVLCRQVAACSICSPPLLVRPSSAGFLPHLLHRTSVFPAVVVPVVVKWVVAVASALVPPVVHFGSFVFGPDHLHGYRLAALHGFK
ncbi:hypothetical protein GQ42DRAFT_161230 [Ramicandelaber brevisporus]|nr:hypothetical protein GQ42DRAFT_161230 [Ramicandelaber brevisporus]